jgi:membrane associated rhomboid family serine protease
MMIGRRGTRDASRGRKLVAVCLILALLPACQWSPAQIYIPLAYAITGMCVALLMSPTLTAALVGLAVGCLLGAAVYNNSLKRQIQERQRGEPRPLK